MGIRADIVVVHSRYEPAAHCLVCGNAIPEGEGLTARFGQRTLRFKCPGCLARFEADPDRYLAGHDPSCCPEDHAESPASEWRCD
jgi:hypothetical protein